MEEDEVRRGKVIGGGGVEEGWRRGGEVEGRCGGWMEVGEWNDSVLREEREGR